jgi:hypothetical protein
VRDTPGKLLPKVESKAPVASPAAKTRAKPASPPKGKEKALPEGPLKEKPDPVKPPEEGANTKKQAVADAAAAADRERITQLSKEAREAEKSGNATLAQAKIDQARDILRPHLPKTPNDNWDEVIKRLDVSSPKDGAVFWSGDAKAAQKFAESINGVTLETTAGGRVIDNWEDLKPYSWTSNDGPGPYARHLWAGVSEKYAEAASGYVNTVQTSEKAWDTRTLWHNIEKSVIQRKLYTGEASGISMYVIDKSGGFVPFGEKEVDSLLLLEGAARL